MKIQQLLEATNNTTRGSRRQRNVENKKILGNIPTSTHQHMDSS